jgi:hypothetical protein
MLASLRATALPMPVPPPLTTTVRSESMIATLPDPGRITRSWRLQAR